MYLASTPLGGLPASLRWQSLSVCPGSVHHQQNLEVISTACGQCTILCHASFPLRRQCKQGLSATAPCTGKECAPKILFAGMFCALGVLFAPDDAEGCTGKCDGGFCATLATVGAPPACACAFAVTLPYAPPLACAFCRPWLTFACAGSAAWLGATAGFFLSAAGASM